MADPKNKQKKTNAASSQDVGGVLLKKWWITAIVILIILGGIILLYIFLPAFQNKSDTSEIIKIPKNATMEMVHDSLAKYYGEEYADNFALIAKIRGKDFSKRHGAYKIDEDVSPFQAYNHLAKGAQHPMMAVVNGARGIDILGQRFSNKFDFSADSLKEALKDTTMLKKYNIKPSQALALFIDDSYEVYWNVSPQKLISKIGDHYNKVWNEQRLEKAKALGLSPVEVITLASIVDEETNKSDEKPLVARLYLNRLKKRMKLQADPTVKFALGDFSLRRIRGEHLKVVSPYNTYQVTGLPPGPIRTVTVQDIDEVLNAPDHDYIYMCAKDDFSGYHSFAKDYGTHMQNARKYQKALNRLNIR